MPNSTTELANAYRYAIKLLTVRSRTTQEISERLTEKQYTPVTVEEVINTLKSKKLLDDAVFARQFIESHFDSKPYGKKRLALELDKRGISAECSSQLLDNIDTDTERERAYQAASERFRKRGISVNDCSARAKLYQYLIGRGFDCEVSQDALEKLIPYENE